MANLPKFLFSLLIGIAGVGVVALSFIVFKHQAELRLLQANLSGLDSTQKSIEVELDLLETRMNQLSGVQQATDQQETAPEDVSQPDQSPSPAITQVEITQTSSEQLNELGEKVDQLEQQVTELQQTSSTQTQSVTTQVTTHSTVKEYAVFLGSGSTTSTNWIDLLSAQGEIDLSKYGSVVDVRFEGTLSIIGGEVRARIINVTTGQIITESEIYHNNNTYTWRTSSSMPLQAGNNLYRVQLRSSSGELAKIESSRIKILVE